jgi:alkyl sulfatase BDS1-like metallo-beta-lactamase superfamily hydrolase
MTQYRALPEALQSSKPASEHTVAAQQKMLASLNFEDKRSFENAARGFIASLSPMRIEHDQASRNVFDLSQFDFLNQSAPDSVNPSLWRQAQLNAQHHGLFEVVEGIYQVRSFDIANMTLVRSDTGWIIIDPLTSSESSRAALQLANQHLGERPVKAVIHTHSHADHFAGVLGVITAEQAQSGDIKVLAPVDFVDEALSENVLAGNVMSRRATYMYGNLLKPSAQGFVSTGLGAALSLGSTGFIPPNDIIYETGEKRLIDGIEIEFQLTMGSEAPAEMVFYFPQFKALCMSEITSHHLHNIYTPRGAQVRDALAWSNQIQESIDRFGDKLEIQFASHHWPIWGKTEALEYLKKQRDLYKYIHDQTLRLANQGYNKEEIAEQMTLPESLAKEFHCRDYYGTVHHNAKAVYVKYLGFFDGNPAHLYELPPIARATRYVQFMGGPSAVIENASTAFAEGDYRWVAEVLNHVVMTDPDNIEARALLADTYEQLGYQAESAVWRNFYLCGSFELRYGLPKGSQYGPSPGTVKGMPLKNLFEAMAVRLNGPRASQNPMNLCIRFEDAPDMLIEIENGVLHAHSGSGKTPADATLTINEFNFKKLMLGLADAMELLSSGDLKIEGDANFLIEFRSLFDQFERRFPIVTPRDPW